MNDRFFLDTNIFVYSFEPQSFKKAIRAQRLIFKGLSSHKGVVSYQVVQEFFNLALRKFAEPMTQTEAEQYLDDVFRPMWAIHSSPALIARALQLCGRNRLGWYDSLIVAAALESQCKILYSEDLHHGQRFGELQVQNPFL